MYQHKVQIEPIVLVHKLFKQMKTCTRNMIRVDRVWSCALSGVNQFCVECRRFEPRTGQVVVVPVDKVGGRYLFIYMYVEMCRCSIKGAGGVAHDANF